MRRGDPQLARHADQPSRRALVTVQEEIESTPKLTQAHKGRALNIYLQLVRVLSETGQPPEFPAELLVPRAAERAGIVH